MRPVCPTPDNDRLFWAARGDDKEVAGFFTNIPTKARPYFDGNDALDDCSNLDLSIGIGRPSELPQLANDESFNFFVTAYKGKKDKSLISLKQKRISNDCNDIFKEENSDCMGLNDQRPGSGSEVPVDKGVDKIFVPFCQPDMGSLGKLHAYSEIMKRATKLESSFTTDCT